MIGRWTGDAIIDEKSDVASGTVDGRRLKTVDAFQNRPDLDSPPVGLMASSSLSLFVYKVYHRALSGLCICLVYHSLRQKYGRPDGSAQQAGSREVDAAPLVNNVRRSCIVPRFHRRTQAAQRTARHGTHSGLGRRHSTEEGI